MRRSGASLAVATLATLVAGGAQAADGPGFGNRDWDAATYLNGKPLATLTSKCGNGVNATGALKNNSHVFMHRGYLFVSIGQDSGAAGGGPGGLRLLKPKTAPIPVLHGGNRTANGPAE